MWQCCLGDWYHQADKSLNRNLLCPHFSVTAAKGHQNPEGVPGCRGRLRRARKFGYMQGNLVTCCFGLSNTDTCIYHFFHVLSSHKQRIVSMPVSDQKMTALGNSPSKPQTGALNPELRREAAPTCSCPGLLCVPSIRGQLALGLRDLELEEGGVCQAHLGPGVV